MIQDELMFDYRIIYKNAKWKLTEITISIYLHLDGIKPIKTIYNVSSKNNSCNFIEYNKALHFYGVQK